MTRKSTTAATRSTVSELRAMDLLGEVITWNARSESTHKHADVVSALKKTGLEETVARELLPRNAFTRACRKMSEGRLIDVVKDGQDGILFQVTKKLSQEEDIKFVKETNLTLNKTTGIISGPSATLVERMQQRLDEAMQVRTTSDITKIVQRLFDKEADLFPIREQGGVYFVPNQFGGFVSQIEKFLSALGGSVTRFPVPAGTQFGDQAVQESITNAMESLVADHMEAVNEFSTTTRAETLEATATRIKNTRTKIEAYAHYLTGKSEGLLKSVEKANKALTKKVKDIGKERAAAPNVSKDGKLVFGYPIVAVVRWCGQQGWNFAETKAALATIGTTPADATIRTQLSAGRSEKLTRGLPATLSKKQIAALTKAKPKTEAA